MKHALLHTDALAVGHQGKALLSDVALHVAPGELVALIGVNGSGKSTLLRTIAGTLPPVAGSVHLDDRAIHALAAQERARLVSVVFTGRPRMGLMDVRSVVALGRQPWTGLLGRLSETDERAVEEALRLTDLASFAGRDVATLSDGEHQRVMIARAFAQATPLLLLDEPTAYLDLVNRVRVMRLLRDIAHSAGRGVLLSTHDLRTALDLADRIALAHAGSLWAGSPEQALSSGVLSKAFEAEGLRFDAVTGTLR